MRTGISFMDIVDNFIFVEHLTVIFNTNDIKKSRPTYLIVSKWLNASHWFYDQTFCDVFGETLSKVMIVFN